MTKEERISRATELFKSGYNCSQSVVAAFADMYGFTEEQALRMAASFGGGIGRMRETCGAACGMFLLAGLEKGAIDGADREGKAANYALVQELAAEFKKRNGSLNCGELLGLKKKARCRPSEPDRTVLCQKTLFENGRGGSQNLGRISRKREEIVFKLMFSLQKKRKKLLIICYIT